MINSIPKVNKNDSIVLRKKNKFQIFWFLTAFGLERSSRQQKIPLKCI